MGKVAPLTSDTGGEVRRELGDQIGGLMRAARKQQAMRWQHYHASIADADAHHQDEICRMVLVERTLQAALSSSR